ncbi:MAG: hypothetical protein CMA63_06330 [Euryarchaeota archaeon]|nr:hypothetical protein [Euryarchaeota archaeon]|tara:strand:- start:2855 stop:3082 length:228 start_codon:yes stop_codon:yes gene_type:complete
MKLRYSIPIFGIVTPLLGLITGAVVASGITPSPVIMGQRGYEGGGVLGLYIGIFCALGIVAAIGVIRHRQGLDVW